MYITLLGSFFNFGRLTSIHTELCGLFGWTPLAWFGISL
jgi:cbb3-type cytochrome oxidase subunit 1